MGQLFGFGSAEAVMEGKPRRSGTETRPMRRSEGFFIGKASSGEGR